MWCFISRNLSDKTDTSGTPRQITPTQPLARPRTTVQSVGVLGADCCTPTSEVLCVAVTRLCGDAPRLNKSSLICRSIFYCGTLFEYLIRECRVFTVLEPVVSSSQKGLRGTEGATLRVGPIFLL